MSATRTNLTVEQGATFSHGWAVTVEGQPIDETWTARSQVRSRATSDTVLHQFAASVTPEGAVVIGATDVESSAWSWTKAVYDVEIVNHDGSLVLRVAEGDIKVDREVTR